MSQGIAPPRIIQNSIPVRYDPRVEVKPCQPDRVPPELSLQVLYDIAKALPQPTQVFNLALASKETWEYLQPALYECEVTYEARLARDYGGQSLTSAAKYTRSSRVKHHSLDTDSTRITLKNREFEVQAPFLSEQFHIHGAMTALHWASLHGATALPVAQKAIRAALAHQPSYINGVDLIARCHRGEDWGCFWGPVIADHPPPLFLAVANGNLELSRALVHAGADIGLLLGRAPLVGVRNPSGYSDWLVSFKIHQRCRETLHRDGRRVECVGGLAFEPEGKRLSQNAQLRCQTVGDVAVVLEDTEILKMLLQNGLDVRRHSCLLFHRAVRCGNLGAVRAMLDHDPGLVHSLHQGLTPIHLVALMGNHSDHYGYGLTPDLGTEFPRDPASVMEKHADFSKEQVQGMISCLLEHGANLNTDLDPKELEVEFQEYLDGLYRQDDDSDFFVVSSVSSNGLTPLDIAFKFLVNSAFTSRYRWVPVPPNRRVLTALRAANSLINMGSNWMPKLPASAWRQVRDAAEPSAARKESILVACLTRTVVLVENTNPGLRSEVWQNSDRRYWDRHFSDPLRVQYRSVRKEWGQICKTIITKATESLSHDATADNRAMTEVLLCRAFRHMVYQANHHWYSRGMIGWWALEALGKLLLSTGIEPGDDAMWRWNYILTRESEAPTTKQPQSLIGDCEAADGDESEWAFLLDGVKPEKTEAA
jgi:hypothetical protein